MWALWLGITAAIVLLIIVLSKRVRDKQKSAQEKD